jgi:hypothetical protein
MVHPTERSRAMHTHQEHIAGDSRALTRGRRVRLFVGTAAFLTVAATASAALAASPGSTLPASANARVSPAPSEHNARVAEHLLQQRAASSEHNARVAEYLLLRRGT